MKRWVMIVTSTLLGTGLLTPYGGVAQDYGGVRPGFWGKIELGAGLMSTTDQLGVDSDNRTTGSLGTNADQYQNAIPVLLFDLNYVYQDSGTRIYLGNPLGPSGRTGFSVGVARPVNGGGKVDVSLFAMPFEEAWENPYLTGVDRVETDQSTYGIRVKYDGVFGSNFGFQYSMTAEEVEDDLIGSIFNDLRRNGSIHEAEVGYPLQAGRGITLIPELGFSRGDMDGDANSFAGSLFRLGLLRFSRAYRLLAFLSLERQDFDAVHPVFGQTREDTEVSMFGQVIFPSRFGTEGVFVGILAGYGRRDSNIPFLDAETLFGGLSVGYEF